MIIYSDESMSGVFESVTSDFKWNPVVGDEGHVEDHAAIGALLRHCPVWAPMYRMYAKSDGEWLKADIGVDMNNTAPAPSSWSDILSEAGKAGVIVASATGDGVTDVTSDSFPNDTVLYFAYAGIAGVANAFQLLREQVAGLHSRLSALEAG